MRLGTLMGGALLMLCNIVGGQEVKGDERVVYAPDVVGVERMFMIALKVPVNAPDVKVTMPDSVTMFDKTPVPAKAEVRRFYFRALKPAKKAEIRFALPDGEVVVPIEIWSFEDLRQFRTLKGVQLPRRWPLGKPLPELKEKQTVTTPAEIEVLKGNPGEGKVWLERSDDDIWAMQPDSTIPRWHWVNIQFGCPVHGAEIYKVRPYYPWIKDLSFPWRWKIKCPIGGEEYPSNDFARGDMTSGPFPDDGIGGGCVVNGKHYGFIAELAQAYDHQMLRVAPECAQAYLATGDRRYVHKALVAFCRLAVEYAYLATMTQHRHRNTVAQVERFGQGRFDEGPTLARSGFTVYCIDQPGYQWRLAEAYDRIFPAIDQDPDIVPFLQRKGFAVKTHEDVRRFIEENLFAVWMQGTMDGACDSNEPFPQRGFARIAEVLNYANGRDFMDWLYDGAGKMRVFVTNTFFRDGAPYESTGGYNGMHVSALGPIIESIEHLRQLRPELYPEDKYPPLSNSRRYRHVFDFDMDTVTIDRSFPAIGDTGSHPVYSKLPKITWQAGGAQAYEHAYRLFRDPKFAWALARNPSWQPSIGFPFTREEIEREAAKWRDDWNDKSSLHDGYGIAILRGPTPPLAKGGQGGGDKRAFWLRYGRARGHTQDDLMDIGLQGYQGILLSHMGYPRNWGYWEHSWTSHHVARQIPFVQMTAQAQLFADAGPVHVAEARAQAFNDEVDSGKGYGLLPDNWQRRTIALIDVAPDKFYCVDFYRIAGGREHWWAFHAQEGEFTVTPPRPPLLRGGGGGWLTKQQGGTLAGPDVPYGDAKWLKENGCTQGIYGWSGPMFAFAHFYNVERGKAEGVWSADWKLKTGDGLRLRLTVPSAEGTEVNICDGKSPAGGSPYEMKWILLSKKGAAPLRTQVLSIIEPYLYTPLIQQVTPLKLSGADEAGFAAEGCVLRLADRTDTVLFAAEPQVERSAEGGWRFAGRFGFYSEQNGQPLAMALVGGTVLHKGNIGIRLDSPEYRARIVKVDRRTETITVSPAPPDVSALVGATLFITSPSPPLGEEKGGSVRRSAYKVLEAKAVPGGAELRLDLDSRIGTGRVTGVEDFCVTTPTPFPLARYRYYHGARLVNADRTAEYRLVDVRGAALIDREVHPDAKADKLAKEFKNDSWFDVYDYGVGDEVVFPYTVSVVRLRPGVYRVNAPVAAKVTLPEGSQVENREDYPRISANSRELDERRFA